MKALTILRNNLSFLFPAAILSLTIVGAATHRPLLYIIAIAIGLSKLLWESIEKIREGRWSLDYIAMLAMAVSLVSPTYYLAGAIVALMITLSGALEEYGSRRAEASLRALLERLPKNVLVKQGPPRLGEAGGGYAETPIQQVKEKSIIFVKTNELIPLDGFLRSKHATINEANLTGESLPVELAINDFIKSGSVNTGEAFELETSGTFETSSYQKIIRLVSDSKKHPAKIVRLAQKFNLPFTVVSLLIAGITFAVTRDLSRTIAVLAIATPCPLLIAAPIAFLAAMSKAARKTIIIKKPVVLEMLSGATTVFLDKTGTLTIGQPMLENVTLYDKNIDESHVLVIAAAIELHSLHPLARAITTERARRSLPELVATKVEEKIGEGITGTVEGITYRILKSAEPTEGGIALDMLRSDKRLARFVFTDELKENAREFLRQLTKRYKVAIITGDTEENARRLFPGTEIRIHARATPEMKYEIVKAARDAGERVVMVGDGLNDAPALALADAGIVFSGTENSASIEAASTAILGHDVMLVAETLSLSRQATSIALQSIVIGIGLSLIGMGFAAAGFITPVLAATIQEIIDVGVTLNALRAAR
jgi:heavy metal translocating P-type ATPase